MSQNNKLDDIDTRESPNHKIIANFDALYSRRLWGKEYFLDAIFHAIKSQLSVNHVDHYSDLDLLEVICKSISLSLGIKYHLTHNPSDNTYSAELGARPKFTNVMVAYSAGKGSVNLGIMFNAIFDPNLYPGRGDHYDVIVKIVIKPSGNIVFKTMNEGTTVAKGVASGKEG